MQRNSLGKSRTQRKFSLKTSSASSSSSSLSLPQSPLRKSFNLHEKVKKTIPSPFPLKEPTPDLLSQGVDSQKVQNPGKYAFF